MAAHVLLTGATGFLGKVVLEQLARLHAKYGIERVTVVVREKRGVAPAERLAKEIVASPCFDRCPKGWEVRVDAVAGDLSTANAGIAPLEAAKLCRSVTHIVHCAASVDFDRPIAEAAQANVVSSLNVLALAKQMPRLERMVATSTAYVTPWRPGPVDEVLAPLPRPAQALWDDVQAGVDEATLLRETGHANTYTYTKCLAEHLLAARCDGVPLSIVRPSIISASWRHPYPGWIDSKAAFAGFVVTIGAGLLQVIDADPEARIDIVPVDVVAERLLDAAFDRAAKAPGVGIVHAVAGPRRTAHVGDTSAAIVRFFREHRVARRPVLKYLGRRNANFLWRNFLHHRLPHSLGHVRATLQRDAQGTGQIKRARKTIATINAVFPYFTHHTFNFASSRPIADDFVTRDYIEAVCRGVATHLMRRDASRVIVGGRQASQRGSDWTWALKRSGGLPHRRLGQLAARKALRRLFDEVSFDETSFVAAKAALPQGIDVLFVPSHRSSFDALLCSYLTFARPDLGFAPPGVLEDGAPTAAPGSGSGLLRRLGRLGARLSFAGAMPPGATADLVRQHADDLFATGHAVQILRESGRRVGRRLSPLRPDFLRRLQASPRPVAVVPIAISYERDPETLPFVGQVPGVDAGAFLPGAFARWLTRAARQEVHLGTVHLRAAKPLLFAAGDEVDPMQGGAAICRALRDHTVATETHLRAFLALAPQLGLDLPTLRRAVQARGGRVLRARVTRLGQPVLLGASVERQMRGHWQHVFAAEMVRRWPRALALQHYFSQAEQPQAPEGAQPQDPALAELLVALAEPILADYRAVGEAVARLLPVGVRLDQEQLLDAAACRDRDLGEAALLALLDLGVLQLQPEAAGGRRGKVSELRRRGHSEAALERFLSGCQLDGGATSSGGARSPKLSVAANLEDKQATAPAP